VVLFQPHRYTRTQALFKEFCTAFHDADVLYLTDIYPASEQPIEGVTAAALLEGIRQHGHRHRELVADINALAATVRPELREGDVVLTLGAGNINRLGPELVAMLGRE
jgi:UDP-N-acetylmuramate--alanine ligase